MDGDRALRRKFGGDLDGERAKLGAFLTDILLGEPAWNDQYAHGDLAGSHRYVHITPDDAGRWLGHARSAAVEVVGEERARAIVAGLRPVALALVNEEEPAPPGAKREARFAPVRAASVAAGKGDLTALRAMLDERPSLVAPDEPGSAEVLHAAVAKGRVEVVAVLVARGIDVNRPARVGGLMVTALCTSLARPRGRGAAEVTARLRAAGAVEDILTTAYLGDVDAVDRALAADPRLADAPDPASDFFASTVVDHAVLGAAPSVVLPVVVGHGATAPRHAHRLLHHAAVRGDASVVELLLARGAKASMVTPGRWVLQPGCARLLLDAGADVNHAPTRWASWVWRSCTGNRGARDDPAYVQALLDAGAEVDTVVFGRTALEHARRAGFAGTVEVLLAAGATDRTA